MQAILNALPSEICREEFENMKIDNMHDKLYGEVLYDINRRLLITDAMLRSSKGSQNTLGTLHEMLKSIKAVRFKYASNLR